MTLTVAVVQLTAGQDGETNTRAAVEHVRGAARAGAQLVVLPEYSGGWAPRLSADLAQPADGPFHRAMSAVAAECAVDLVVGSMEPADGAGGRCVNVALAFGPDGRQRGRYEKVHLFDAFGVRESDVLDAGAPGAHQALVLDVAGVRVGVATCYDLRFPESFRVLVDAGAQVLVVMAAWADGPGKADQLEVLVRARAIENTAYLALASQHGSGRTGRSQVVDPLGRQLAVAQEGDAVLLVDLDEELVADVRGKIPSLEHRRYTVVPRD
ncbi:carbon-nitrogen hydrolase family protein [Ruania halotolerans]|uniref:carbon-nitrogen hydrolase family protein n=1 Tax=Ruania halotolerans TaxID=2897773 RepID=UPI001E2DA8CA|nr:carbon-nitrogen hydrolase family protein [Ruania halotolerans]UFU07449.1 carbon-nitrogen hydrolase family protein [Ruania halotolerans]